jgi:glycine reductase
MAKELERAGIPTALITAMVSVAERVGAPRIVPGRAVVHPVGDPTLPADAERALRRGLIERALEALQTPVDGPRVFDG